MIKLFRNKVASKAISIVTSIATILQILLPTYSYGLTGGPSQPEVESFTPVGTTDMVDLFTGDFNYNIPLLSVDGYPVNLAYSAGAKMDQEASWVGLGWNLNPGVINRNMRGVPDDFNGEQLEKKVYMKPNWTVGINGSTKLKLFGMKEKKKRMSATASLGLFYNNYKGFGVDASLGGFNIEDDPAKKEPKDSIKLQHFLIKSAKNIANDIFPEGKLLMAIYAKDFRNTAKQIVSVSDNYSSRSFAYGTYTPNVNMEFIQQNYKLGVTFGIASGGIFGAPSIGGSFAYQELAKNNYNKNTYGYLYHWNKNSNDVILDINREKDGDFTLNKPVLPIPISTYDLFSISGQGVSGQIKPFRNGIDVYFDDQNKSTNVSGGLNLELGLASDIHTEIHANGQTAISKSEKWANDFTDYIEEKRPEDGENNDKLFERTYFRTVGERIPLETTNSNEPQVQNKYINDILMPIVNTNFIDIESPSKVNKNGDYSMYNFITNTNPSDIQLNNNYTKNNNHSNIFYNERTKRNQLVSYLTYQDQTAFVQPEIESFTVHSLSSPFSIERKTITQDPLRKPHHIGQFMVTKNDGSRYVYGIAAYNKFQREVSFTTAGTGNPALEKGIISYASPDTDILKDDDKPKKGFSVGYTKSDEFYSSTKTGAYAHSYLLTSILSDDYLDVLPNGVGPEDLGNFTKFEYERVNHYNAENNGSNPYYKWRTPYKNNEAQFSEGLRSEKYDNKASFVEGEKEIWHLSCIKSKNQIAVFVVDQRNDGLDASISNPAKSQKLSRIILYDRMEFEKYLTEPLKYAKPIKTVHFVYNYDLCNRIENSSLYEKGKLTLTSIYTTFGSSSKKFAAYNFVYNDFNPDYNMANIDRWGGYKPWDANSNKPNNMEFPFVEQNENAANQYAMAWSLTKIILPSGGTININYESDDYAYVQNKRAMQMTQIAGIGANSTYARGNLLYEKSPNNYLFFPIPSDRRGLTPQQYIDETMKDIKNLCFKVKMKISGDSPNNKKYEWVNGYADVESYGLCSNTPSVNFFYVQLKEKDLESFIYFTKTINPITKSGFNFMKTHMPHVINPDLAEMATDNNNVQAEEVFYKLIAVGDIFDKLQGIDNKLLERKDCNEIEGSVPTSEGVGNIKGWVRLNNPFKDKLGGGYRVKKITIGDNWKDMSSNSNAEDLETGQEFDYTTQEDFGSEVRTISSGVAAFEPSVGSEENPFKQPIGYERKVRILPNEEDYIDGPVGESFYPSATVGYSKVTVSSLRRLDQNSNQIVKKHGIGKTIHEFYTAKDFPTIVNYTTVQLANINPPIIDLLFYSATLKKVGVSQGFEVILNDMHGKPKAQYVYSESQSPNEPNGKLITSTKYFYQTEPDNPSRLNNNVKAIYPDKSVEQKTIGVETEIYADNRSKTDDFYAGAVELNWTTLITAFGLTFPTIIPEAEYKTDCFYSSTLVTVKNYYGIQNKTEVSQDGAYIYSENLAYDAETGELLVSKTTNEFKEEQYNTTYPAHWAYNSPQIGGMGQGYKNIGVDFKPLNVIPQNIALSFTSPDPSYIENNDEVICYNGEENTIIPVEKTIGVVRIIPNTSSNNTTSSQFEVYYQVDDRSFQRYTPLIKEGFHIKVIRSGRRNMQSQPVLNITTLLNPIKPNGTNKFVLDAENYDRAILDAKANTFSNAKYEYKSFTDALDVPIDYSAVIDALNYLFANQQIDLNHGVQTGLDPTIYHGGLGIVDYHIPINANVLSGNNPFTNSFFHKINIFNGHPNYDIILNGIKSYPSTVGPIHPNQPNIFSGYTIDDVINEFTIDIPIYEIVNNTQSSLKITLDFVASNTYLYNSSITPSNCNLPYLFRDYKLSKIEKNGNLKNNHDFDNNCNYYVGLQNAQIIMSAINPSVTNPQITNICQISPNSSSNNTTATNGDGYLYIDIVRCPNPSFRQYAIEDHLFHQFQIKAINPVNNWKPSSSYVYKGDRDFNMSNIKNNALLQNRFGVKGIYKTYSGFKFDQTTNNQKWKQAEQSTLFDPYTGSEIESKDALGRYRSIIYSPNTTRVGDIINGYNNPLSEKSVTSYGTKPSVFAENARHCEVNVFNFESDNELQDRSSLNTSQNNQYRKDQHYFVKNENTSFNQDNVHTGKQSIEVKNSTSAEFFIAENYSAPEIKNAILPYYPTSGKHLISGWVKVDKRFFDNIQTQPSCKIEVIDINGNSIVNNTVEIAPSGPIISGWQRFQGEFSIPKASDYTNRIIKMLRVTLKSGAVGSTLQKAYFDDIRMHPINANSKNYVYDEQQRISAILDENNYATFYYYDHKGELAVVKRETEKGIVTISETRKLSYLKEN